MYTIVFMKGIKAVEAKTYNDCQNRSHARLRAYRYIKQMKIDVDYVGIF